MSTNLNHVVEGSTPLAGSNHFKTHAATSFKDDTVNINNLKNASCLFNGSFV